MEEQKKLRVVAYCRISSTIENTQSTSLKSQQIYYENFIKQHSNWEYCGLYAEQFTGTKLIRPEFSKMLLKCGIEMLDDSEYLGVKDLQIPTTIDLIVIKSSSRIARNINVSSLIEVLTKKNIGLYIETMDLNTLTMPDISILSYLIGMDAQYSKNLSKTMRKAYKEALEYRNTIYRNGVYGMEKIGTKENAILKPINEDYKNLIEKIFNLYLDNYGFKRIAKWVNENTEFKSTKQNPDGTYKDLTSNSIKCIISQPKYAGFLAVPIRSDEDKRDIGPITRKDGNYYLIKAKNIEPCISEELYYAVQEKIKSNPISIRNRGVKQHYSKFSRLLVCGNDHQHFNRTLDSHNKPIYVCKNRKKYGADTCNMPILSEEFLNEELKKYVKIYKETIKDRKDFVLDRLELLKYNLLYNYFNDDNTEKISNLKNEIKTLKSQGQNLLLTYSLPTTPNETKDFLMETINDIAFKRKKCEKELHDLENSITVLKQNIELISTKKIEVKKIEIKEEYTEEEVLKNISEITVNYKMEKKEMNIAGFFMKGYATKDIEENKKKRQKRNDCNLEFSSKLDYKMEYLIGDLEQELGTNVLQDFSNTEKRALDDRYMQI